MVFPVAEVTRAWEVLFKQNQRGHQIREICEVSVIVLTAFDLLQALNTWSDSRSCRVQSEAPLESVKMQGIWERMGAMLGTVHSERAQVLPSSPRSLTQGGCIGEAVFPTTFFG